MDENERRAFKRAVSGARPVGAYVAKALDPAARARGFAITALLAEWPAIIGDELARFTMPDRVVWPRRREDEEPANPLRGRRGEGATLVLRVEGPRAIEVQHRSGQILERVNLYFGYRAITEMRILQAPVVRTQARPAPPEPPGESHPLPPSSGIEDEGLRKALSRLGSATRKDPTKD
jgi:hypothetical protein